MQTLIPALMLDLWVTTNMACCKLLLRVEIFDWSWVLWFVRSGYICAKLPENSRLSASLHVRGSRYLAIAWVESNRGDSLVDYVSRGLWLSAETTWLLGQSSSQVGDGSFLPFFGIFYAPSPLRVIAASCLLCKTAFQTRQVALLATQFIIDILIINHISFSIELWHRVILHWTLLSHYIHIANGCKLAWSPTQMSPVFKAHNCFGKALIIWTIFVLIDKPMFLLQVVNHDSCHFVLI